MNPPGQARVRVVYTGRVQGVGFRYATTREASGRPVAGSVRNLRDGRVELVAEGERDDVEAFLEAIASGPLARYIDEADTAWSAPTGEFDGFAVRW